LDILKPIVLVNRFELLDFALNDEERLTTTGKKSGMPVAG
jgi:hypothetical protein